MADADPPAAPRPPAQPPPLPPLSPPPTAAGYGGPMPVLPYGQPHPQPYPPSVRPEDPRARRLIFWSRLLGWGGVALFIGGSCAGGLARREEPPAATLGFIVMGAGLVAAVAGGIIGQIGRAMQGRVI